MPSSIFDLLRRRLVFFLFLCPLLYPTWRLVYLIVPLPCQTLTHMHPLRKIHWPTLFSQIAQLNSKYSSTTKRWYYFIDKPSFAHHCSCLDGPPHHHRHHHTSHHTNPPHNSPASRQISTLPPHHSPLPLQQTTPDTRHQTTQDQHFYPSTSTSEELRGRSGRTSGRATRGNSGEDVGGPRGPGYEVNETYCGKGKEREGSKKGTREGGSREGWWWRA